MNIHINSTTVSMHEMATLKEALDAYGAKPPFAVALNDAFIARAAYEKTLLQADDTIEVVKAVGGG